MEVRNDKISSVPVPPELQGTILFDTCFICGSQATFLGIYKAPDPIPLQHSEGATVLLHTFPVCVDCLAPEKKEQTTTIAETKIIEDLFPMETEH